MLKLLKLNLNAMFSIGNKRHTCYQSSSLSEAVVQQFIFGPSGYRALWSQAWLRKTTNNLRWFIQLLNQSTHLLTSCFEAISGFAKLLSPKSEFWIAQLTAWRLHVHFNWNVFVIILPKCWFLEVSVQIIFVLLWKTLASKTQRLAKI